MGESPAFVELHSHTSASFDSLASPQAVVRAAAARGLTHLAVTDHDRIDGALRARDAAPDGLTVLVGEEIRTADGDLIAVFLERPVPPGLPVADTIAAVREQGGLVGVPHPFDRLRGSLAAGGTTAEWIVSAAGLVDWIEVYNARAIGRANERAASFAREHGLPGVAVSDSHSTLEVAVACTRLRGNPSTPAGLLAALSGDPSAAVATASGGASGVPSAAATGLELITGRASYAVRLLGPVAKAVQWARGNRRIRPVTPGRGPIAGSAER
jgi:predicted metal-dependent phosphoesterase TrpH